MEQEERDSSSRPHLHPPSCLSPSDPSPLSITFIFPTSVLHCAEQVATRVRSYLPPSLGFSFSSSSTTACTSSSAVLSTKAGETPDERVSVKWCPREADGHECTDSSCTQRHISGKSFARRVCPAQHLPGNNLFNHAALYFCVSSVAEFDKQT